MRTTNGEEVIPTKSNHDSKTVQQSKNSENAESTREKISNDAKTKSKGAKLDNEGRASIR